MTYAEALAYISGLETRGWRLGLDRMAAFVRAAALESAIGGHDRKFVHIAGTNGKGSTTAFAEAMLRAAGYRTGAFFSPFVVDIRERVQFGGELISREDLAAVTAELQPIAEAFTETDFGGISEFEFKTAVGFRYWEKMQAEWVALEVGLGGRLDSTNVVHPAATIIVSIGLDHMHILGDTIEKIAAEKAGIIKAGIPVIVGDIPPPALEVILDIARERRAPAFCFGEEIRLTNGVLECPWGTVAGLRPSLAGVHQPHNAALAAAALLSAGVDDLDAIRAGAETAWLPGRFHRVEFEGRTIILDGAHNPDAATALAETLRQEFGADARFHLITNMLTGHDIPAFYRPLADQIESATVVPIDFFRARPPEDVATEIRQLGIEARPETDILAAIRVGRGELPVLVTGSNYLVGAVLRAIG